MANSSQRQYAIGRLRRAKHAWCWRVNFSRSGQKYSHTFYDLKHGGKARALAAAIEWRDTQLRKVEVLTRRQFNQLPRSNNTSGTTGVHFLRNKRQPLGLWQARVKLPRGRLIHRSFAVKRFGERNAYRQAVQARKQLLELVPDQPYLHSATAKRFAR